MIAPLRPVRSLAVLSMGRHLGMLMLRFYLDDSGHAEDHRAGVLCVAGCLATLEAWERFQADWKAVLDDSGVTQLHMKHLAHFRGEFEDWKEETRKSFLGRLMALMERERLAYIGHAVVLDEYGRDERGAFDPHHMCFLWCVLDAAKQMEGLPPSEKLEVFIAARPKSAGWDQAFYAAGTEDSRLGSRLGSLTTNIFPVDVVPLQAADLVAYELNEHVTDGRKKRWPIRQLLGSGRASFKLHKLKWD